MKLDYLLFDFTDEEGGSCSFDALASVLPARLPDLIREVEAVLQWAHREFGAPSGADDEGEWSFELQAFDEHDLPLEIGYDLQGAMVSMPHAPAGPRVTLALTVAGSRALGEALRLAFPDPG